MKTHHLASISADEAAELVYSAGIMSPCPPARGFAFRQFLRELKDRHGYNATFSLVGATQKGHRKGAPWTLHSFEPPSREKIAEAFAGNIAAEQEPTIDVAVQPLPDYLKEGLDVVFVGTSAGEKSAQRRHYYSHETNKFWELTNKSGLIPEYIGSENDYLVLDEGVGLTDVSKTAVSSSDGNLKDADYDVAGFREKVQKYKPKVVAFNGKRAYKEVFGHDPQGYGLANEDIADSFVFVLPSSSGADTNLTYDQKLELYIGLKTFLGTL